MSKVSPVFGDHVSHVSLVANEMVVVVMHQLPIAPQETHVPVTWLGGLYGSVSKPCTPVVHIKIAGKWMFIPLKMVLIGIDP